MDQKQRKNCTCAEMNAQQCVHAQNTDGKRPCVQERWYVFICIRTLKLSERNLRWSSRSTLQYKKQRRTVRRFDMYRRTVGPIGVLRDENMPKSERAW